MKDRSSTPAPARLRAGVLGAFLGLPACAALVPDGHGPRLVVPGGSGDFATRALAAAHPLPAGQNIGVTRLGGGAEQSYHLVQVRDREAPHRHRTHSLAVTLLVGSGTLHIGSVPYPMAAGDVAVVPADTVHRFVNAGPDPAVAFVVFAPAYDGSDQVPEAD